ncbi:hypothetical protein DCC62_07950 [candidate division KSB1 bacterium]|nr:MAG: hypothetical protein DCC62_07950 [candidate division KSB1 bacterium]
MCLACVQADTANRAPLRLAFDGLLKHTLTNHKGHSMASKTNLPQVIAEFLIDNFTILLTIGFAGFIIYRREVAQIAVSTDDLLTGILGVLALLATSEIVERYRRLNSIERAVNRSLSFLENRFTDRASAIAFFKKHSNLDQYFEGANQIDLCGVTLTTTINKQFGNLRERLQAGARIRILVVDPDSTALKMSAERSTSPEDVDYYRVRLDATLREIEYLFKSWDDFKSLQTSSSRTASLSVRLLSYAPSFGILSFDANQDNGIALVEIYPHKFGHKSPPTFDLTSQRDGNWYKYFIDQFDEMWNVARPWQSRNLSKDVSV